jgi:hypothetical protein
VKMVRKQVPVPWRVRKNMMKIIRLAVTIRAKVVHKWRESNFSAD